MNLRVIRWVFTLALLLLVLAPTRIAQSASEGMTPERWSYLLGLVLTAGVAIYFFRAAEMSDGAAKRTRMRTNAWVAVFVGILSLYLLIFDPASRYLR
jgi:hypothetical protein